MPIQYADMPKQPDEVLRYSMTFTPGGAIATGDSLTGNPTITVTRIADSLDVTGDYDEPDATASASASPSSSPSPSPSASPSAGPPSYEGMVVVGSVEIETNIIYCAIQGGQDGYDYKITFTCSTTNGETVEEDLVIQVREY